MNLTELPILSNLSLFAQLFHNYTRLLDMQGAATIQEFIMSEDSFQELKEFIKQFDKFNKESPLKKWEYLGRFIKDNEPMLPNLESETPFLLIDGYKFNIKIDKQ